MDRTELNEALHTRSGGNRRRPRERPSLCGRGGMVTQWIANPSIQVRFLSSTPNLRRGDT